MECEDCGRLEYYYEKDYIEKQKVKEFLDWVENHRINLNNRTEFLHYEEKKKELLK